MINSLKIINWSYDLCMGMHLCMFSECCSSSQWHLWLSLQPCRVFQVCLLRYMNRTRRLEGLKKKRGERNLINLGSNHFMAYLNAESQWWIWVSECKYLRLDSSWRGTLLSLSHTRDKAEKQFLFFFCQTRSSIHGPGLTQKHLSFTLIKRRPRLFSNSVGEV